MRNIFGVIFALGFYYLLPFPLEIRRVLARSPLRPSRRLAPVFYRKTDRGRLALQPHSSIAIMISLFSMTVLMLMMHIDF
jgi:hypothetical protein